MKNDVSIDELEKRMRPHAYSEQGFLGSDESLESVLRQDEIILKQLGISFEEISAELNKILLDALILRHRLRENNHQEYLEREHPSINWQETSIFSLDNLPSPKTGFIVDGKYQVFFMQWRGTQDCPWNCALGLDFSLSSVDLLLLNRKSGNNIKAPGLIGHLIQKHHFFEGVESPYRVDPIKLATVLGFVSSK